MAASVLSGGRCAGVYEIVNLVNGKRYIGSSVNIRRRWHVHRHSLRRGKHHSSYLQSSWDKYGEEAFGFRVLLICHREQTTEYEQRALNGLAPEFNAMPVAGVPPAPSAEARRAIAKRMRGNQNTLGMKHTPEAKALLSAAKMGNPSRTGMKNRREHTEKVAEFHRGRKRSAETRARISAAMTGKKQAPRSDEYRAKLSAALKGKPKSQESIEKNRAAHLGKVLSEEHKAKIGRASREAWARRKAQERGEA